MPIDYTLSVLLSAFLLFQVQPLIGKVILPWFGGTPMVWSTVLLFFQTLLTAGYAYATWLVTKLRPRMQGRIHLGALAVSLGLVALTAFSWPSPLTPDPSWRPTLGAAPIPGILRILAAAVGVPYLILSANSTLMQTWFFRQHGDPLPYRLYALSNVGSLLALVSYPLVFEPLMTLRVQADVWAVAYVLFAVAAGVLAWRASGPPADIKASRQESPAVSQRPTWQQYALWVGLAAVASSLLVSVTNQMTQEVAVIPFLWVLPLAVYLLTFVLAFSGERFYDRRLYLVAFGALSLFSLWSLVRFPPFSLATQLTAYTLLLFVACMLCHNELYRLRPLPGFLSAFYLMVAIGGALGGMFVTLLAPSLFSSGFWELQWSLVAAGLLMTVILIRERPGEAPKRRKHGGRRPANRIPRRITPAVWSASGLVVLLAGLTLLIMRTTGSAALLSLRSFYGISRVWAINTDQPDILAYQFTHGKTVHGFQFAADRFRVLPTAFYSDTSGVGLAFLQNPVRPGSIRVGGLGMGVGVIAAYGQPGDTFRFYEINPDVIRIAEGEGGYFSFLSDTPAQVDVVQGDARLALEDELAKGNQEAFDLLVLDAFSGDTIPLHLLTREAFEIYLKQLAPGGIIAVHVSNRNFDLALEVYRLADAFDLSAVKIEDAGDGLQSYDSVWMLLTNNQTFLSNPNIIARASPRPAIPASLPVWTDNYSNLLAVLK
jgi:SAM-dependent methyltransferase